MSKGDLKKNKKKGGSKKKGVVYVAKRLQKNYPSRYSSVEDSRARAKEIISELGKDNVTWSKAKELEKLKTKELYGDRYSGVGKKKRIQLPPELVVPVDYYDSAKLNIGIRSLPEKCVLRADFFDKDIPCGLPVNYYFTYFKQLSDVLDRTRRIKDSSNIFKYRFLNPIKEGGKLVVVLYLLDGDGDQFDLDIVVSESQSMGEDDIRGGVLDRQSSEVDEYIEEATKAPKKTPSKKEKPLTGKEQIELEKLRSKNLKEELKIQKQKNKDRKFDFIEKLTNQGKTYEEAIALLKKAGL